MQVFIRPVLEEGRFKSIKTIHHPIRLLMGSLQLFCFISVAPMVCVSRTLAHNAVDVNKLIAISSTKLPLYACAQVTAGLKLYLGLSANPW